MPAFAGMTTCVLRLRHSHPTTRIGYHPLMQVGIDMGMGAVGAGSLLGLEVALVARLLVPGNSWRSFAVQQRNVIQGSLLPVVEQPAPF